MSWSENAEDSFETAEHPPRRRFLVWAAATAATCAAARPASAAGVAWAWRDRWLFRRLSRRRPQLRGSVTAWPAAEGETLVGWRDSGPIVALNETATYLLGRCRGEETVAELALELGLVFGATKEEAQRDAALTIRELARLGLIDV